MNKPRPLSAIEESFALQVRALKLPEPVRELVFAPPRKWRADFAWRSWSLLVEIEGGVHSGGRHVRGNGFEADAEKYNAAALLGYTVLRFTARMVRDGSAVEAVRQYLATNVPRVTIEAT